MHASTAHAAYPPKSTYPSSADAEGGGREFRAVVHPTGVEIIRVGIDDRTRQPVRQRPVCFQAGLRQQPDFPAREARRRGETYAGAIPRGHMGFVRCVVGASLIMVGGSPSYFTLFCGGFDHRQRDFSLALKRNQDRMAVCVVRGADTTTT